GIEDSRTQAKCTEQRGFHWRRNTVFRHCPVPRSCLSSDPPVGPVLRLDRGIGGQARPDNPWFDKLTMTIVTLSLSKGGFPDQACLRLRSGIGE
ncbi:MAG: hypothetical protein COW52_10685, partial [Nitrospirae bacterium CG17_big_fil_post_rev_8_21_14_2_50_50_9]